MNLEIQVKFFKIKSNVTLDYCIECGKNIPISADLNEIVPSQISDPIV